MKIVLATGIYPPDIGGPATYVAELEKKLGENAEVKVITYGDRMANGKLEMANKRVIRVSSKGGMISRWMNYSKALKEHAADADVIIAFTSVSVGIPLILSRIKKPTKILRLGGEFFWERYTDGGGHKGLHDWYASRFGIWRIINKALMESVLRSFDAVVYSTTFQKDIHAKHFHKLPPTSVIENAVPEGKRVKHTMHEPLKLLFMGRFVRFKNIPALIEAVSKLDDVTLTIAGRGPVQRELENQIRLLHIGDRVHILPPMIGPAKEKIFAEHDLLVIPSVTEISPNVALEAASCGLPVLLTAETGLSDTLSKGMLKEPMEEAARVLTAIIHAKAAYAKLADAQPASRSWEDVTKEWLHLISR